MVMKKSIENLTESQVSPGIRDIQDALEAIDASDLIDQLELERDGPGPHGYPPSSMWRAYFAGFILNLSSMNALVRLLEDDPELRMLCGFSQLPHRTTFNRFRSNLTRHRGLVESMQARVIDLLRQQLPDFGKVVAVDSTVVRTHSNENRKPVSDPEASWTKKNAAASKGGKQQWYFGYKFHAIADATHDIPICGFVTTATRNDSPFLPDLLNMAADAHPWLDFKFVLADRGYDAQSNHKAILKHGAVPVIHIRDMKKKAKKVQDRYLDGNYTHKGVPVCMGMHPMEYIQSDPQKGHLYRCRQEGCHLKDRQGVVYCKDEHWENNKDNPRLFGPLRRDSKEWKGIYPKRQSIERVFKSMKESRRLNSHYLRGLENISLHVAMSMLSFQATNLMHLQRGEFDLMRWMVRKVA